MLVELTGGLVGWGLNGGRLGMLGTTGRRGDGGRGCCPRAKKR